MNTFIIKDTIENNLLEIGYSLSRISRSLEQIDGHSEMMDNMLKLTNDKAKEFERLAKLIEIVQNKG